MPTKSYWTGPALAPAAVPGMRLEITDVAFDSPQRSFSGRAAPQTDRQVAHLRVGAVNWRAVRSLCVVGRRYHKHERDGRRCGNHKLRKHAR